MNNEYEMIICITNNGFSEQVMEVAKEFGAKGGTVINARGTAKQEALRHFDIEITPEKEITLILVETKIKDNILSGLYDKVGLNTPGQGIAFSLPVEDVVGLTSQIQKK